MLEIEHTREWHRITYVDSEMVMTTNQRENKISWFMRGVFTGYKAEIGKDFLISETYVTGNGKRKRRTAATVEMELH